MDGFDVVEGEEEEVCAFRIEGQDDDSDDSPEMRDDVRDLCSEPLMLSGAQVNPMRRSLRSDSTTAMLMKLSPARAKKKYREKNQLSLSMSDFQPSAYVRNNKSFQTI